MNEPAIACAAFFGVWILCAVALFFHARRRRFERIRSDLADAALRLGGSVTATPLTIVPDIRFQLGNAPAEARFRRSDGSRGFEIEYSVPRRTQVCSLVPCGTWSWLVRLFRFHGLETGDYEFDRTFAVEGNDAEFIRSWLSPETRSHVYGLQRAVGVDRFFRISLAGRRLLVESDRPVHEDPALVGVVLLANRIAELALQSLGVTPDEEVRVIAISHAPAPGASCQVCGDPLGEQPVLCTRCRTPHHRECWEYVGGCSTFACQTREFVPA